MPNRSPDYLRTLVRELRSLPRETEWVEFKENRAEPEEIGEYISAISNAAALVGKTYGYLVWGVEDGSHDVVGTSFDPRGSKVGNEELENWLLRQLSPKIDFRFLDVQVGEVRVVILEVDRAWRQPVRFKGVEFIRVGSYKKKLKEFPEKERQLWRIFDQVPFEAGVTEARLSADQVLKLLDYPSYFTLLGLPLPTGPEQILAALASDELVRFDDAACFDITNLGAILFARDLNAFSSLRRKVMRVIQYDGVGRVETLKEQMGVKGYASGFEGLISYINGQLPSNEVVGEALRRTVPMFPELAVREVVANALIHQDFSVMGAGPMVEIFKGRIEVTNPGVPLVSAERFLDSPPRSRNEALASLLRRIGVCEERGSGVDKIVFQAEFYQLPAPLFEAPEGATKVTLFAYQPLSEMAREDKVRACYLHACLRYVERQEMTNATVRERFGIEKQNSATASRLIKEAVTAGMIGPYDAKASRKLMRYVPFWAMAPAVHGGDA